MDATPARVVLPPRQTAASTTTPDMPLWAFSTTLRKSANAAGAQQAGACGERQHRLDRGCAKKTRGPPRPVFQVLHRLDGQRLFAQDGSRQKFTECTKSSFLVPWIAAAFRKAPLTRCLRHMWVSKRWPNLGLWTLTPPAFFGLMAPKQLESNVGR